MGERNGVEGGEKAARSCFLSSQVTALSCSWKGELSLTPSLVCVGKKRSSNLRSLNQATALETHTYPRPDPAFPWPSSALSGPGPGLRTQLVLRG